MTAGATGAASTFAAGVSTPAAAAGADGIGAWAGAGVILTVSRSAEVVAAADCTWFGIGGRVGRLNAVAGAAAALTIATAGVTTGLGWLSTGAATGCSIDCATTG